MGYELHPSGAFWQHRRPSESEIRDMERRAERRIAQSQQTVAEILAKRSPFAVWLRGHLERRNMTMTECGRAVGSGRHTVSAWVTGKSKPKPKSVARLAALFGEDEKKALAIAGYKSRTQKVRRRTALGR